MITTVLLDLDDTLLGNPTAQFVENYFAALNRYLPASMSRPLLDAVRAIIGQGDPTRTNIQRFYAALAAELGDISPEAFQLAVSGFYREAYPALRAGTTRRPIARRLVEGLLARGYTLVVATNPFFPRDAVEQRLAWAGVPVDEIPFALVTHLENMHFTKERPEYYEETLARVGASAAQAVMVGDDWFNDIVPAWRAGLRTFWIGTPGAEPGTSGPIRADGCGSLDDFARAALDEGWLSRLAPRPVEPQQIAPRLMGSLAALIGTLCETGESDRTALLGDLIARERDVRARLAALAGGDPPGPDATPDPDTGPVDVARLAAERQTTIDWLRRLDPAAWTDGLLAEAERLAAADRDAIARLAADGDRQA